MRPVVLALVPRDDQPHSEVVIPMLTMEAEADIPIWWTMVVDEEHGRQCINQITKVHDVKLLITFGDLCSPWTDPEKTPSIGAIMWPSQVEPIKLIAFPAICPVWWDDESITSCARAVNTALKGDLSHFEIIGSSN